MCRVTRHIHSEHLICVTWLIHMCHSTRSYVVTHKCVSPDSFICHTTHSFWEFQPWAASCACVFGGSWSSIRHMNTSCQTFEHVMSYVYLYTHICIYTHTYTHIYTRALQTGQLQPEGETIEDQLPPKTQAQEAAEGKNSQKVTWQLIFRVKSPQSWLSRIRTKTTVLGVAFRESPPLLILSQKSVLYSTFSSKLTFLRNFTKTPSSRQRILRIPHEFSKVSSMVILYSRFSSKLTFLRISTKTPISRRRILLIPIPSSFYNFSKVSSI